jgi:hypothetical protein
MEPAVKPESLASEHMFGLTRRQVSNLLLEMVLHVGLVRMGCQGTPSASTSLCGHCTPLQAVLKESANLEVAELAALEAQVEEPDSQQFFQLSQELNMQVSQSIVAGELGSRAPA